MPEPGSWGASLLCFLLGRPHLSSEEQEGMLEVGVEEGHCTFQVRTMKVLFLLHTPSTVMATSLGHRIGIGADKAYNQLEKI